jgi:hypothetical protein
VSHSPDVVDGSVLQPVDTSAQGALADHELLPRQCGRCRLLFEGDPTLHPPAQPGWWLCPPCQATLLGRTPHPDNVAPRRHVGHTA